MRIFWWMLLGLTIVVSLILVGAVFLVIEAQPRVQRTAAFTPENIERAKRILDKNDPRKMKYGVLRTIVMNEEDVDLAANYLANRYGCGSARIVLKGGTAFIQVSTRIPGIGWYANIDAALTETAALPHFTSVYIGRLPVPSWGADWLLTRALTQLNENENYGFAGDVLKQVSITAGRLSVIYAWRADLPDKLRAALLPRDDQERLRVYHEKLGEVARALTARSVSLTDVLPPLFKLGLERARSRDPVAENRAVILVLTFYVNGKGLAAIVPAAKDWPRPTGHSITLHGRGDFPQHFTISAALAANAGGPLSDAVGLYKEVDDSRVGSGFSFNDIAADRAGTRFGELAAGSKETAAKLQQRLSAGVRERDLMPATDDLPEFMPEAEFKRRFGGIGAPVYQQMMMNIERRLAALPLYRVP
jgi:hypothetical protein